MGSGGAKGALRCGGAYLSVWVQGKAFLFSAWDGAKTIKKVHKILHPQENKR